MRPVYKPYIGDIDTVNVESWQSVCDRRKIVSTVLIVNRDSITITPGPKLRTAMILAIVADLVQLVIFPLVVVGAPSPADDILDVGVAGILSLLLGWHWEFLPSFLAKLVPGVDLVPCWTIAVANVYRKSRQIAASMEGIPQAKHAQRT